MDIKIKQIKKKLYQKYLGINKYIILILVLLIKKYQKYLSPDHSIWAKSNNNPPYCKFIPSCSDYMIQSIEKKGIIIGILKGFWRICRCMPWSKGGYDPVK